MSSGGVPKLSDVLRLVKILGRGAYNGWVAQIRAANHGRDLSQEDVDMMLTVYESFTDKAAFQQMVQAEYGGGAPTPGTDTTPVQQEEVGTGGQSMKQGEVGVCALPSTSVIDW